MRGRLRPTVTWLGYYQDQKILSQMRKKAKKTVIECISWLDKIKTHKPGLVDFGLAFDVLCYFLNSSILQIANAVSKVNYFSPQCITNANVTPVVQDWSFLQFHHSEDYQPNR